MSYQPNYGEPPPAYAPYGGGSQYPPPQQGYPHPHGGYPQNYPGGYPQYPQNQQPGGYGQQPGGYPYGYGQTVVVTQPHTVQQPQNNRDKDRSTECCLLGLLALVCCCCIMD